MAGPHIQTTTQHRQQQQQQQQQHHASSNHQRPVSAYYSNASGGGGGGGMNGNTATSLGTISGSASHSGLHALRQVANGDTELIYRGGPAGGGVILGGVAVSAATTTTATSHNGSSRGGQHGSHSAASTLDAAGCAASTSRAIIQQQPNVGGGLGRHHDSGRGGGGGGGNIVSIAGPGTSVTDALIAHHPAHMPATAGTRSRISGGVVMQRSVEIIVDASAASLQENSKSEDMDDVEKGQMRKTRHRHRPLHRRLISYVRSLFQGNAAQNDSELEEFETPARYRPDSLSALSRATRFTEDEIKRIYRGFKAECPTGVVKEDTFKVIYSQFFPQGGSCANPTLYAHYVFNTLDQDHSGIVSFEDFVLGLSILSRGSIEEKLRWTFSLYDINGDGFITRDEMTDIVTAIYELMGRMPDECPEEEKIKNKVERIFQKMDINRDGVVTLDEFLEACRNDDAISRSMSVFDTAF